MLVEVKVLIGIGCLAAAAFAILFGVIACIMKKSSKNIDELIEEQELKRSDADRHSARFVIDADGNINLGEQRRLERNELRKE